MTLSFSTKWPKHMGEWAGQPNNFVGKIWRGMIQQYEDPIDAMLDFSIYAEKHKTKFRDLWDIDASATIIPKLHTIRHDPHGRWKAGMKIHPVINNRTPHRFQFAPTMVCTRVQEIEIDYCLYGIISNDPTPIVVIDGAHFYNPKIGIDKGMLKLAQNDGFESIGQFFAYFSEDFQGKIIHWADIRY